MPDKRQECDRIRGMENTCVRVCPASQDDRTVVMEERVMTPLHKRVSACKLQLHESYAQLICSCWDHSQEIKFYKFGSKLFFWVVLNISIIIQCLLGETAEIYCTNIIFYMLLTRL